MNWKKITLDEFIEEGKIDVQTGPFGTQLKASDYSESGTPVINVRNIGYSNIRPEKIEHVPDQIRNKLKKHLIKQNDIVFGRKGAVDRHLLVKEKQEGWIQGSDCIRMRINTDEMNSRFISYSFLTEYHKAWIIKQCSNKATMPSLNQDVISRIELKLPPIDVQNRIASTLSAYDELIQNNKRRIELLEKSARLLYKEWFVQLRFPGHEHTKIIDGVPEGWNKIHLSEIVSTQYGYTESATEENVGPKFLRGTDINKTSYIDWSGVPYCPIKEQDYKKYELFEGDILAIRMADPGKVALIEEKVEAVFASYLVRLKILDKENYPPLFVFYTLMDNRYQGFISGASTGSTRKSASAKLLTNFDFIMPEDVILHEFIENISTIRNQIKTLVRQNGQLKRARDLLLPRLMNGNITV